MSKEIIETVSTSLVQQKLNHVGAMVATGAGAITASNVLTGLGAILTLSLIVKTWLEIKILYAKKKTTSEEKDG